MLEFKNGKLVDPVWTTTPSGALRLRQDAKDGGSGGTQKHAWPDALILEMTSSRANARGALRSAVARSKAALVDRAWTTDEGHDFALELFLASMVVGLSIVLAAVGYGLFR